MSEFGIGPLVAVGVVVMFGLILRSAGRSVTRRNALLRQLADELGLPLVGGDAVLPTAGKLLGWMRLPLRIERSEGGRPIKIFHFTRGTGKSRTQYVAIHLQVNNPHGLRLQLNHEGYLSRIGRALGMQDIETGDAAFDKSLVVKSKQPEFARTVLIPELRAHLLKAYDELAAKGVLKLEQDLLSYEEVGTLHNGLGRRRFAVLAPACLQLADAVEVYSESMPAEGV